MDHKGMKSNNRIDGIWNRNVKVYNQIMCRFLPSDLKTLQIIRLLILKLCKCWWRNNNDDDEGDEDDNEITRERKNRVVFNIVQRTNFDFEILPLMQVGYTRKHKKDNEDLEVLLTKPYKRNELMIIFSCKYVIDFHYVIFQLLDIISSHFKNQSFIDWLHNFKHAWMRLDVEEHTHARTHTHAHIKRRRDRNVYTHTRACIYTYICIYTYKHTHIYMLIHIYAPI